ncbi:MAG: hypothetical protein RJA22_212 [Verrucomicrobiota bacterium]
MSSPAPAPSSAPLVIGPQWRRLPMLLAAVGLVLGVIGAFVNTKQFAHSYLLAFMFFLSLALGGLFLTLAHHLFDASWSVATRRLTEHLAWLLPIMFFLFLPLAVLAPKFLYTWMQVDPHLDHALHAKQPVFTLGGFYAVSFSLFAIWTGLVWALRSQSLAQDKTGAAQHTFRMRFHSGYGIFLFAITLTLAAIFWVKALEHQWFSTMYGVYFFAESVWTTLATLWVLVAVLTRTGHLKPVVTRNTMHCIGLLWFAFTVFYAYIHFSQYFLQWNANLPEETFWYVKREQGSWWGIGMLIVFGHFLAPFLLLLRIDAKLNPTLTIPLAIWAWAMHFCDMSFNIMPVIHPQGFVLHWMDLACLAFVGGVLTLVFLRYLKAHPAFPVKDPRLGECLGVHGPHPQHVSHPKGA